MFGVGFRLSDMYQFSLKLSRTSKKGIRSEQTKKNSKENFFTN